MPSTRTVDRPREARAAAQRYLRRERPLSALIVVLAVAGFLGTFIATSLAPAVVVGGLLIIVARAPIIESRGTVRLQNRRGRRVRRRVVHWADTTDPRVSVGYR
ncbi:hypothetical protein [Halobellus marinus]|uniref:hypothetical protein n=1 Tax=Halobellus marinus TaxID=3075123 RepID=UPI0028ABD90D|nr:hypothetical protein [Halobellus sp. DFY28]